MYLFPFELTLIWTCVFLVLIALLSPPDPAGPMSQDVTITIDETPTRSLRSSSISARCNNFALDTSFYNKSRRGPSENILQAVTLLSGELLAPNAITSH